MNTRYQDGGRHGKMGVKEAELCASNADHLSGQACKPQGDMSQASGRPADQPLPSAYYYQGVQPGMKGAPAAGLETRLKAREEPFFRLAADGDLGPEALVRPFKKRLDSAQPLGVEQVRRVAGAA